MSRKKSRISIFSAKGVELVTDENSGFATASISINPNITWIKFVLLDDKPNANNHRVPESEFDNVIRTGLYMPIKMGVADAEKNHEDSRPLGVITHLVQEGNLIEAIAALWNTERNEDVTSIKERFKDGHDINLSWELQYTDFDEEEADVVALRNIAMNAATIVDVPAYGGRTNVTALAETDTEEGNNMETIEKTKHDEIVSGLEAEKEELVNSNSELQTQLDEVTPELEELREYKETVEAEKQKVEKLNTIKTRISEAGLELDEEYFTEREEFLLSLDEEKLDFYIQDMVAFSSKNVADEDEDSDEDEAEASFGTKIPNLDKKESKNNKEYNDVLEFLTKRDSE